MPQFVLDHGTVEASEAFARLDEFTQGYLTAVFWTDTGEGELEGATVAELAPETLEKMVADCHDFQHANATLLAQATARDDYTLERAGVDFWLTRNGHGAGFWDRGLGKVGDDLTKMSKPYGSVDLYRGDDQKIYGG